MMKRITIITITLLLSLTFLHAQLFEEVSIGFGNDWVTLGLGDNWDDALSYGFHAKVKTSSHLLFTLGLEGYTDKFNTQERYDVTKLNLTYPFLFDFDHSYLRLMPVGGILISGNLGFQSAQNLLHRITGKDEVFLAYPPQSTQAHLSVGGEVAYGVVLTPFALEGVVSLEYDTGWEFDWEAGIRLRMRNNTSYLTLSWREVSSSKRFLSQDLQSRRYEGLQLTLFHDGAIIQSFFSTFLLTGYAYGGWMVNALAFNQEPTFTEADIAFGMGIFLDPSGLRNRSFEIIYKQLSLELRYKNGPIENSWFQIASYLGGYRFDLYEGVWAIPYVKVLAGVERFTLKHETGTVLDGKIHPSIALEAGSYFGKPKQWVLGNLNYRPRIASSIHYIMGNEKKPALPSEYQKQVPSWIFQLGIALEIQHDLH